MRNPAEQILKRTDEKLDAKERLLDAEARAKYTEEQKQVVMGNIVDAGLILRGTSIEIPEYATAEGEHMKVCVDTESSFTRNQRGTYAMKISGTLSRTQTDQISNFPMYKITQYIPKSDTIGNLPPSFEIAVADPDSDSGYTPLALVAGTDREAAYPNFSTKGQLDAEQRNRLATDKLYINPHAEAMLAEVHSILDMAITQQQETQTPVVAA